MLPITEVERRQPHETERQTRRAAEERVLGLERHPADVALAVLIQRPTIFLPHGSLGPLEHAQKLHHLGAQNKLKEFTSSFREICRWFSPAGGHARRSSELSAARGARGPVIVTSPPWQAALHRKMSLIF